MSQPSPLEPTILGAVFRRWRLVAVFIMMAVALSLVFLALSSAKYQSTATVVLEDPRSEFGAESFTGFDQAGYVAQQANLAESRRVERLTWADVREEYPDRGFTPKDVKESIVIDAPAEGAKIDLNYVDTDQDVSQFGAEALLRHFKGTRDIDNQSKLDQINSLILDLENEITGLERDLNDTSAAASTVSARIQTNTRESAEDISQGNADDAELARLTNTEGALRDELTVVRTELRAAQLDLTANDREDRGIALEILPNESEPERQGSGAAALLTLAVVLGTLLGTAVAYLLSVRKREFSDKAQPEVALGVPLITEIANPAHEKLRRLQFPVVDAPESAVAEGFRFVAAAIATELTADDVKRGSVGVGASTTTANSNLAVANIGLALASQGLEVLLVDADVRRGELTEVLCADQAWDVQGLTDVLSGSLTADRALRSVVLDSGDRLELLSAGTLAGPNAPACRPDTLRSMLIQLEDRFDVVLVNVPALLHSADSASVLGAVGNVVLLVDHGSSVDTLLDAAERIEVAHTSLLGYVYTNAPLSRDLANYVRSSLGGGGKGRSGRGRVPFGGSKSATPSTNGSSSDLIEAGVEAN